MVLKRIGYSQFPGTVGNWSLKDLTLGKINLLVGKNATGKTNTLTKILWLGDMLASRKPELLDSGNYDVEFIDDKKNKYNYKLILELYKVEYEELIINGKQQFERDAEGRGKIFATQYNEKMDFQLQPGKLVVASKRDAVQHPFLEELVQWAENQGMYAFGSDMGKNTIFSMNGVEEVNVDPYDTNLVAGLYKKGSEEFPHQFEERVMHSMNKIGYELHNIGTATILSASLHAKNSSGLVLSVVEKAGTPAIYQSSMSQGMFRALSIIIHLAYHDMMNKPATILIDDIGEGLDFERSTKLIKLLIELAEKNNNIQLIMSTNDRFVMNNVPLGYWQVIQRVGGECQVSSYQNNKKKFDEFAYMGLNNFDFLATDYINSEWKKT